MRVLCELNSRRTAVGPLLWLVWLSTRPNLTVLNGTRQSMMRWTLGRPMFLLNVSAETMYASVLEWNVCLMWPCLRCARLVPQNVTCRFSLGPVPSSVWVSMMDRLCEPMQYMYPLFASVTEMSVVLWLRSLCLLLSMRPVWCALLMTMLLTLVSL